MLFRSFTSRWMSNVTLHSAYDVQRKCFFCFITYSRCTDREMSTGRTSRVFSRFERQRSRRSNVFRAFFRRDFQQRPCTFLIGSILFSLSNGKKARACGMIIIFFFLRVPRIGKTRNSENGTGKGPGREYMWLCVGEIIYTCIRTRREEYYYYFIRLVPNEFLLYYRDTESYPKNPFCRLINRRSPRADCIYEFGRLIEQ